MRCDDAVIAFACGYSSHRLDVFAVCKCFECPDSATGWMILASYRPLGVRIIPVDGGNGFWTGCGRPDLSVQWMFCSFERPLSIQIHPAAGCFCLFTGDGASRFPIGWMVLVLESPLKVLILPFTG